MGRRIRRAVLRRSSSKIKGMGRAARAGWARFLINSRNKNGLIPEDEAVRFQSLWRLRTYTLKDDPQPQVLFTFGFSNLKPAPSSVST
jgi:hypothetical protein